MKTMILYFKDYVCNESKGIQKIGPNVEYYGPPILAVPTHEENTKWLTKKIRRSWKWFSNVKTMIFYFKDNVCNESKGIQKLGP